MFGTPAFGAPSSTPAFGTPSSTPAFGTPSSTPAFATPSSTPAFATPSSTPAFGTPSLTSLFGTPTSTPAFGTPSTPSFGAASPSPFFQQPQQQQGGFSSFPQQQQQQQQMPAFGYQQPMAVGSGGQIVTQMAPVAPLSLSLADREIQAIIDAYRDDPGNPKNLFRHLLFSVTDPTQRVKPVGVSDIMWSEAMTKLEGMDTVDRERLWPQLVQGFKDLSLRLKIQDDVIVSDTERLKMSQKNVKMLQNHMQADTLIWIQRLRHKEQELHRRLLRVMRTVEALENRCYPTPLTREEVQLHEKLNSIVKQLEGPGTGLPSRARSLLSMTRLQANTRGDGAYLLGSANVEEQSLYNLQEVLHHHTEAIAKLRNVFKKVMRDMEIIMGDGSDMIKDGGRKALKSHLPSSAVV